MFALCVTMMICRRSFARRRTGTRVLKMNSPSRLSSGSSMISGTLLLEDRRTQMAAAVWRVS